MGDMSEYIRKEWAKVEEEEANLPRVRIVDLCCPAHELIKKIPGKGPIPSRVLEEFDHAFNERLQKGDSNG